MNASNLYESGHAYLLSKGLITEVFDADNINPDVILLAEHYITETGDHAAKVADFMLWTKSEPELIHLSVTSIALSRSFHIGDQDIKISMSTTPADEMHTQRVRNAYIRALHGSIMRAHTDLINSLANTPHEAAPRSQQSPTSGVTPSTETAVVPISRLTIEKKNGKRIVRVAGGRYEQFGVAFYPEHIEASGFAETINALTPEEYPAKGTMLIEMRADGKPSKVLKIKEFSVGKSQEPVPTADF